MKELDAYLAAEEALVPNVWEASRTITLLISQVSLGTLLKGPSSSFSLNSRLRSSLPGILFFNLHPHYAFVASEDNPAHDPSRQRPVQPPCIAEPAWLSAALRGSFQAFDTHLASLGSIRFNCKGCETCFDARDRACAAELHEVPGSSSQVWTL